MTAGQLRRLMHFQKKVQGDDGWGGVGEADWQTQFTAHAEFTAMRGGEQVAAARLQGRQPYVVRVRQSTDTRAIRHDWRLVDARTGEVLTMTSPVHDPDGKRANLEFVVESGVQAGGD